MVLYNSTRIEFSHRNTVYVILCHRAFVDKNLGSSFKMRFFVRWRFFCHSTPQNELGLS